MKKRRKFQPGNPGVRGTAGTQPKASREPITPNEQQLNAVPKDGKAFGINKGFGVYKDKNRKLTYKGSPFKAAPQSPKPGSAVGAAAGAGTATGTILGGANQRLRDISGYYSALAGILQGVGPGIESAYRDTAGDIAGYGKGFSDQFRTQVGQQQQDAIARDGAGLTPGAAAVAGGGYDPNAAADAAFGLSAYLPAKTLAEQGAAFGAAGRMLPGKIAQQGLYALNAEEQAQIAAAEKAGAAPGQEKANASLSKALGYLVDSYGNPILNAKGKPIKLPGGAGGGLTPYQQKQLELSTARENRAISAQNFRERMQEEGLKIRQDAANRQVQNDLKRGKTIDAAASRVAGHIVYKDGSVPRGKNGKPIPVAVSANATTPQTKAKKAFQSAVATANSATLKGKPLKGEMPGTFIAKEGQGTLNPLTKQYVTTDPAKAKTSGFTYGEAVTYLMNRHGINRATAQRALKAAGWVKPGNKPAKPQRPNFAVADEATIVKYGQSLGINPVYLRSLSREEQQAFIEKIEARKRG